jgi:hypothetical protein
MTARGRQYYDPEIQTTRFVPGQEDLNRIEIYPVGPESTARLPQEIGKWASRRVDGQGNVVEQGASDTQQDRTIALANERWPDLEVYVLGAEIEDSTWEGVGPSPRLWRNAQGVDIARSYITDEPVTIAMEDVTPAVEDVRPGEMNVVHAFTVPVTGVYVALDDILLTLEYYARQYDEQGNPSGALALREAATALKEPF